VTFSIIRHYSAFCATRRCDGLDVGELSRDKVAVERQISAGSMLSAFTAWPSRLLAAAAALALMVASVIGAYAHAAGHEPPHSAVAAAAQSDAGGHGAKAVAAPAAAPDRGHAHGPADCGHDQDRPGHSLDCCDTACHGAQAILAEVLVVPASLLSGPSMEAAAALDGADSGGLDRPPKPFRFV
jgi:hypothetical protein